SHSRLRNRQSRGPLRLWRMPAACCGTCCGETDREQSKTPLPSPQPARSPQLAAPQHAHGVPKSARAAVDRRLPPSQTRPPAEFHRTTSAGYRPPTPPPHVASRSLLHDRQNECVSRFLLRPTRLEKRRAQHDLI